MCTTVSRSARVAAACLLFGLAGTAQAQPRGACIAAESFERHTIGDYSIEIPAGWSTNTGGPDMIAATPAGGGVDCSFEAIMVTAAPSFEYDASRTVATFFSLRRDLTQAGDPADLMLGNAVPAKRFGARGHYNGRDYLFDVVAASRGTKFFWVAFATRPGVPSQLGQRLFDAVRLLPASGPSLSGGVRSTPDARAAGAAVSPARSGSVDAGTPLLFEGPGYTFSYPRGWSVDVQARDRTFPDYHRVRLSSGAAETIEVWFKRIPERRIVGDSAREADGLMRAEMRDKATYLAGYEEVFPGTIRGRSTRMVRHFKHADAGTFDLITAPLDEGQNFALVGYLYDTRRINPTDLSELVALSMVLTSFRFERP